MGEPVRGRRRLETLLAWLGFAGLVTGFWAFHIYGNPPSRVETFAWIDLYQYVLPAATFIREELTAGRLPLWNPYQLAGMPIASLGMPGALYPGNLTLLALLPAERALEASTLIHWTLAGGFTWLFARRMGLGFAAASAAALTFVFSGRILSGAYQHFVLTTQVWLPALLWAIHGLVGERRARWMIVLSAALSLSFLGGYVQTFVYSVQLAAVYGLCLWLAACPGGERLRAAALVAGAGALALACVAPQLLATLEFTKLASRSLDGIPLAEAAQQSVAPTRLLHGWLGAFAPAGTAPQPYPWLVSLPALTAPLIVLAAAGRATRRHTAFFAVVALAAALFMLGTRTPVFTAYHALPLGNLFRFPVRMDFVYVFSCACLIGCGIQAAADFVRGQAGNRAAATLAGLLTIGVGAEVIGRSGLDIVHPVIAPPERAINVALTRRIRSTGERVMLPAVPKTGTREQVFAVADYEPSLPRAYGHYFAPESPELWHGRLGSREEIASRRLLPLLDRMSVRFYAAPDKMPRARLFTHTDGQPAPEQPRFAERAAALPRVYVADRVRAASDPTRARRLLLDGELRDVVVDARPPALAPRGRGSARLVTHSPQDVRIETDCETHCLVVLTDLAYPGWQAQLDGVEVDIVTTNLLYRGVVVPPGTHELVHRYRPVGLRRGAKLGAGLLALTVAVATIAFRRGRLVW